MHEGPPEIRILHLIHSVSGGGASRAMSVLALRTSARSGRRVSVVSLTGGDAFEVARLRGGGIEVIEANSIAEVHAAMERADIVHAHVWNNPELFRLLRSHLPPLRLLFWFHVAGRAVPQVFPPDLVSRADVVVAACREAHERLLPLAEGCPLPARLVHPAPEAAEFAAVTAIAHDGVRIGYIGSLDELKIHPATISFCRQVVVPGLTFVFIGDGQMRQQMEREANAAGIAQHVEFTGYLPDVRSSLARLDMLGFPFSPKSYFAADLAVMEAMAAGVPPVVMAPGARYDSIVDGADGLIATTPEEYVRLLRRLVGDKDLRTTLGAAARAAAVTRFDPANTTARFDEIYDALLRLPKRARPRSDAWRSAADRTFGGSDALLYALGDGWPALADSRDRRGDLAILADAEIADADDLWLGRHAGGLLHYLAAYPQDPWLLFWRSLNLAGRGRYVRASAILAQATAAGFPDATRADEYRAILLGRLRDPQRLPEREQFADELRARLSTRVVAG